MVEEKTPFMEQEVPLSFEEPKEVPDPEPVFKLEEQIAVVAEVRAVAKMISGVVKEARLEWEEANSPILQQDSLAREDVSVAEDLLRALTLIDYGVTGNKAPAVGVGIREVIKLDYDQKVAFDWAKSHKMALKLDTSAFEKIIKATPVDFVKITTEPQATIATNLDEVLKDGS